MYDPRFSYGQSERGFATAAPIRLTAASADELYAKWREAVARFESLAGRPLSTRELRNGVDHADDRSSSEKRQLEFRRKSELNPETPDERTKEQRDVDFFRERAEQKRVDALPPEERMLHDAEQKLKARQEHDEREAAMAAIRNRDDYRQLHNYLSEFVADAKFDPGLPQSIVDEAEHQLALLERFGDTQAVQPNFRALQTSALGIVDASEIELRKSVDRVAESRKRYSAGVVWGAPPVPYVDGIPMVKLTRHDGAVVHISQRAFDESSEQQLLTYFQTPPASERNQNESV
jgi:hypothetical protein